MPIYEYSCDECGHSFEVMQKFSDSPIESCELCGGPVRKVLYPVAIHFKGSGFYTTDYARRSSSSPSPSTAGDGGSQTVDAGGGEEAPAFKPSEKSKAENRQKKAEASSKAKEGSAS